MPDEQSKSSRAHSLWMPAMTPVPLRTQSAHDLDLAPLRFPANSSATPALSGLVRVRIGARVKVRVRVRVGLGL
eukprot:scaffold2564_cov65-Phaeocystis_antarctica.AAC.10